MPFFRNRRKVRVTEDHFSDHLHVRNIEHAIVHETPSFRYPTAHEIATLEMSRHIWSASDSLAKLAHTHYGDVTKWKIIAFINKKPTDAFFSVGDVVYIPKPLERVLELIGG